MREFVINDIETISENIDKFYYELNVTNCKVTLTATINVKYGFVLIDILQKVGFVKTEDMDDVYKAIFNFLDTSFVAEIAKQEKFNVYLDPAGDDHYFNQKLNEEGILHFHNYENEKIFDDTYELLKEMLDEVVYVNIDADDEDFDFEKVELNFNVDFDDDDLPF